MRGEGTDPRADLLELRSGDGEEGLRVALPLDLELPDLRRVSGDGGEGRPGGLELFQAHLARALEVAPARLGDAPQILVSHAPAAALLANGTVALFDAADEVLGDSVAGSPAERREAFASLLASVADELGARPTEDALTGPVSRGDARVVEGHLELLRAGSGEVLDLYRLLSRRMLRLTERRGQVPAGALRRLEELLEG